MLNTEYKFNNVSFDSGLLVENQTSLDDLFHGVDWLSSTVSTVFSYDFKVWYLNYLDSVYSDNFDFFLNLVWFSTLKVSSFQLFWASILDTYLSLNLFHLPELDSWYRNIFMSVENSSLLLWHPEFLFIQKYVLSTYNIFQGNLYFSLFEGATHEVFYSPVLLVTHLLFLVFFASIFILFYFSFFNSSSREEVTVDADYLVVSGSVESEKEISSYDDMSLGFIFLIYIFGWFFYVYAWSLSSMLPELTLVFYLFPMLYFIIIGIPTFLIYDFGIFFLAYLRGVGASPVLIFELVYDYIAVIIFYTRIVVQGVRLVLMLGTFVGMHDVVIFFYFEQKSFLGYEYFFDGVTNLAITLDAMSYFILFTLPGKFVHWLYEILHTFFVVTVQFFAFFAIVFWLFLFLYTFFVAEKQENYFFYKRQERAEQFKTLYELK